MVGELCESKTSIFWQKRRKWTSGKLHQLKILGGQNSPRVDDVTNWTLNSRPYHTIGLCMPSLCSHHPQGSDSALWNHWSNDSAVFFCKFKSRCHYLATNEELASWELSDSSLVVHRTLECSLFTLPIILCLFRFLTYGEKTEMQRILLSSWNRNHSSQLIVSEDFIIDT